MRARFELLADSEFSMAMLSTMNEALVAWIQSLLAVLRRLWRILLRALRALLSLFRGEISLGNRGDDCCIDLPDDMRPRPDPYVYSQTWLEKRGIAYTWDNPDFTIVDKAGNVVDRMKLQPGETYEVVIRVHNGSLLAAMGTGVTLEARPFGIGGAVTAAIGSVHVDIPAMGTVQVPFSWTTRAAGGHNCLVVRLSHPDDGNSLNNVGQHNTQVAPPEGEERRLSLVVRNNAPGARQVRFAWDSYRLPAEPMRPRSVEQRRSQVYLRELRDRNSRAKYPVPAALEARLDLAGGIHEMVAEQEAAAHVEIGVEAEVTATFRAQPSATGESSVVNVHAFDGDTLLGGVTIYVDPKGA